MTGYRYKVVDVHGSVPEQIATIAGKVDAYLVYSEYRGPESLQEFWRDDVGVVGCWYMEYAGEKPDAK